MEFQMGSSWRNSLQGFIKEVEIEMEFKEDVKFYMGNILEAGNKSFIFIVPFNNMGVYNIQKNQKCNFKFSWI